MRFLRWLTVLMVVGAIGALAGLWAADLAGGLHRSPGHSPAGAIALILIGAAFAGSQYLSSRARAERLKALVLGLAFMLWGAEQFLAPGPWTTAADNLVITVFVGDLALLLIAALRR